MSEGPRVAAVAIGRNEGERLRRCLRSLVEQGVPVVYVDSGSRDDSVAFARSMGCAVVALDMGLPFTAARARNSGFAALDPRPDYVQFVDGDCAVEPGWIAAGVAFLDANPGHALVTGWRSEITPEASVWNAMCDHEWHRPAGDIAVCGGDMMVRSAAFAALGGFNPAIIAAEDDDFCLRLGKAGHRLHRLPVAMTRHDAAILRLSQWWQRATRAGHGFAEVGALHPPHFRAELRRAAVFGGVVWPLLVVGLVAWWPLAVAMGALIVLSWWRSMAGLRRDGIAPVQAARVAVFLVLSKLPNLAGMARYHLRRLRGDAPRLIEYK
jgi:GT2 family glycosyltransferase